MAIPLGLLLVLTAVAVAAEPTEATDPADMDGITLFKTYCKTCHGADAEAGEYSPLDLIMDQWDEVFDAIHAEGAIAGVHCCGNTDWSLLMATSVDVLNLDAYNFLDSLALYPAALRAFLEARFAKWWVPDAFEFVDAIPRTATGKFLKSALREQFARRYA